MLLSTHSWPSDSLWALKPSTVSARAVVLMLHIRSLSSEGQHPPGRRYCAVSSTSLFATYFVSPKKSVTRTVKSTSQDMFRTAFASYSNCVVNGPVSELSSYTSSLPTDAVQRASSLVSTGSKVSVDWFPVAM
jgi:hypothetical protein